MDKVEYYNFIKDLKKLFINSKFVFISDTVFSIKSGKIPEIFFALTDIDLTHLYKNFEDVYSLNFPPFDYLIKFCNKNIFLKLYEAKYSNPENIELKKYLLEFTKFNSNPLILNAFFDPFFEITYDFNSVYAEYKNNIVNITINTNYPDFYKNYIKSKYIDKKLIINEKPYLNETFYPVDSYLFSTIFFSLISRNRYKILIELDNKNFFKNYLPEINNLKKIYHTKDYHPEGNAFDHSLLTVKNTNTEDFATNFAALYHDTGKFETEVKNPSEGESKFPFHSSVGAKIALKRLEKFNKFLNFYPEIVEKTVFLIKNHMKISFLPSLDYQKQELIIESPYLKDLLKLYKADILASYKPLSNYKNIISYIKKKGVKV